MKRKRFSIEQIVAVLKQAELDMPVVDVIRQVGISEQTLYRRKKQYTGMCSGQLIPDTALSFSSATAGASPSLN